MKALSLYFVSLAFSITWKITVNVLDFDSGNIEEMGFDIQSITDEQGNQISNDVYFRHFNDIELRIVDHIETMLEDAREVDTMAERIVQVYEASEQFTGARGMTRAMWEDSEIALDWRYSQAA